MQHLGVRRGDTLIEVVISLAILASVITIATSGSLNAWRASRLAGERTKATGLAQRQADALKAYKKSKLWAAFKSEVGGSSFYMSFDTANPAAGWVRQSGALTTETPFEQKITPDCPAGVTYCNFTVSVKWQSTVRPNVGDASDEVTLFVRLGDLN